MTLRLSTLGNVFVVAGSVVGVATVAAVATGAEITLTPAMIQLLIYKGLAAMALGLIVVGSWLGRRGRQHEREETATRPPTAELSSPTSLPFGDAQNEKRADPDEVKRANPG